MFTLATGSDCYLLCSTGRIMPGIVNGIATRYTNLAASLCLAA